MIEEDHWLTCSMS